MQSVINFVYDFSFCELWHLPVARRAPPDLVSASSPLHKYLSLSHTCVHVNTCVHSPVYTCTLPSSTDWIWQSAEWCCHERTLCSLCCQPSAANCPAELRSHSAADVTQFITTQLGLQLQCEVTLWTVRDNFRFLVYDYVCDVHS